MKKVVVYVLMVVACCGIIVGCSGKDKGLTGKKFEEVATEKKFTVVDALEHVDKEKVKSAKIAVKDNAYQVEFYRYKTEKECEKVFKSNKKTFKISASDEQGKLSKKAKETKVDKRGVLSYTLIYEGTTNYISKVGDTLLVYSIPENVKDGVKGAKALADELGY